MRGRSWLVVAVGIVALGACGDQATTDEGRGYTKAPLEDPNLFIEPEGVTEMARLNEPLRPNAPLPEEPVQEEDAPAGEEGAAQEQVALAAGVTQEQFDQGQQLFTGAGACAACHGPSAGGTTLGPNLSDAQWLHVDQPSVDAIAEVIRTGVAQPIEHPAPMPPMGGANLSDDQVQALAAYVASISQG